MIVRATRAMGLVLLLPDRTGRDAAPISVANHKCTFNLFQPVRLLCILKCLFIGLERANGILVVALVLFHKNLSRYSGLIVKTGRIKGLSVGSKLYPEIGTLPLIQHLGIGNDSCRSAPSS